ncbi:aspartyl-phosphate phosphatase Spo0E family protein [Paenibacillus turicensis]|uniref:aspartyl-phosphate phosphatase Spo0E family protein n=1 Tax=Paenibacillus turicensis TaxID=160487 RepID=UPI003D271D06
MEIKMVQARIEKARNQLHILTEKYNGQFGHPQVISQSVLLDELINQYNRLRELHKKKPTA